MTYGELGRTALRWATTLMFGLEPDSMPERVVISPFAVEEFFEDFQDTIATRKLTCRKLDRSFLVGRGDTRVLFCRGGIGASIFADFSYILCHCPNVREIIFVGTGGGLGRDVNTVDINIPPACLRLDKVLEIMLPPEAPAKATPELANQIRKHIEREIRNLGVRVHSGLHATVPFLLSETKQLLTGLQNRGVISVDMELSVLYALANRYGKQTAGIIRIGDLPMRGLPMWKSRNHKLDLKRQVHNRILNAILNYTFTR